MFLKEINKEQNIASVREHLRKNTNLAAFLQEYSQNTPKPLNIPKEYVEYSGAAGRETFVSGTTEMLALIKLAKLLDLDENHIYETEILKEAFTSLHAHAEERIGMMGEINWRTTRSMIEGFQEKSESNLQRAVFLFKLLRFQKNGEDGWFRYDFVTDYEAEEIEMLSSRAAEQLKDLVKEDSKITFFPSFGEKSELFIFTDLLIDDQIIALTTRFNWSLKKQTAILRACQMLNPKITKKYIFNMRNSQLFQI